MRVEQLSIRERAELDDCMQIQFTLWPDRKVLNLVFSTSILQLQPEERIYTFESSSSVNRRG